MKFKEARERAGLSATDVMRRSGISRSTVHSVQSGRFRVSYGTAIRLARALEVDPASIDEFRPVLSKVEAVEAR